MRSSAACIHRARRFRRIRACAPDAKYDHLSSNSRQFAPQDSLYNAPGETRIDIVARALLTSHTSLCLHDTWGPRLVNPSSPARCVGSIIDLADAAQ